MSIAQRQLEYLVIASRSKPLCALVLYWCVGNAIFATLYDYGEQYLMTKGCLAMMMMMMQ